MACTSVPTSSRSDADTITGCGASRLRSCGVCGVAFAIIAACGRLGFDQAQRVASDGRLVDSEVVDGTQPDVAPACGGSAYMTIGAHRYRYVGFFSFGSAAGQCTPDNAHLVIVNDANERDAILTLGTDVNDYWMGLHWDGSNATTDTGDPATYLPWGPGQPLGAGDRIVMSSRMTTSPGTFFVASGSGSGHVVVCECDN